MTILLAQKLAKLHCRSSIEADLLKECVMLTDGLNLLPYCFAANDISAVLTILCCDGSLMYA